MWWLTAAPSLQVQTCKTVPGAGPASREHETFEVPYDVLLMGVRFIQECYTSICCAPSTLLRCWQATTAMRLFDGLLVNMLKRKTLHGIAEAST